MSSWAFIFSKTWACRVNNFLNKKDKFEDVRIKEKNHKKLSNS